MGMTDFVGKINKEIEKFDDQINILADEFSGEVIIPICKRYGLRFVSGMGRYFFVEIGESLGGNTIEDASEAEFILALINQSDKDEFDNIFDTLDTEVCPNRPFGYYVEGVK